MAVAIGQDARQAGVAKPWIIVLCVVAIAAAAWRGGPGSSHAASPQRLGPSLVHGFLATANFLGTRVAYLNRNALGDTYILGDGRLLHALPAGTVRDGGVDKQRVWVIVERAAAASKAPVPSQEISTGMFYMAPRSARALPLHSYERLDITDAFPGIDMSLRESASGVERVYTVHPGASADQIRVSLDGATNAQVTRDGDLNLSTGIGTVRYRRPTAYQLDNGGRRIAVPVAYRVFEDAASFGFTLGPYDRSNALIIDPVLQGTYLSTPAGDAVYAMAVDPISGDVLAAGFGRFPVPPQVTGGFQLLTPSAKTFVVRCDAKLEKIVQGLFLGGGLAEESLALAIDPRSGDVYVGGGTSSNGFPATGGGAEPTIPIGTLGTGFVSKLSGDLQTLRQTTFFSPYQGNPWVLGIAVSPTTSDVYVVGRDNGGAVVTRYNDQLTQILSRYVLQGNVSELSQGGNDIAINPNTGDVYVTGVTQSWKFPGITGGAYSSSAHGSYGFQRVFVSRFDAALTTNLQSTYLADGKADEFHTFRIPVAVDPRSGDVIVAAEALGDLGRLTGGAQADYAGGNSDALIVRFSADLRQVRGASYFGGAGDENISGIGISNDGQSVYAGGFSDSSTFPGSSGSWIRSHKGILVRFDAQLRSIQSMLVYAGDYDVSGYAMGVHPHTNEVYLAGATYGGGLAGTRGGLTPDFVPTGLFGAFMARFDSALAPADSTTPEQFAFRTQSGVAPGSLVTSNAIRIYGYSAPVTISVTGGSYSLDGDAFTTADGTLQPGQRVQLQHTAAVTAGGQTLTRLTVGGVAGSFTSITQSGATIDPAAFSFTALSPVAPNHWVTSNAITVQGTDSPAPISVSGGQYSVDDGPFTSSPGIVNAGQTVVLGQTTAAELSTETDTILTIGGVQGTFSTVTDALDTTPHPLAFGALGRPTVSVPPDSDVESSPAFVFGINGPAPISVTGGRYKIGSGSWTSGPGTVNNLDGVLLQVHTGSPGSRTQATVTVGGVSSTFVAVADDDFRPAQRPAPFSIPPVNGVEPFQWIEAPPVAVTGYTEPTRVSFSAPTGSTTQADAQFFYAEFDEFLYDQLAVGQSPDVGLLVPGQPLRVRVKASEYDTTSGITVNVGGVSTQFSVTTIAEGGSTTPTAFQFADHAGVAPGTIITSELVQLHGLGVPGTVNASGCEVSVSGGPFSSGGTVLNGDTLALKIAAPGGSGQSTTCMVSVGNYSESVTISTSGGQSSSSSGGSGSSSGGGGGGAVDLWSLIALGALLGVRRRPVVLPSSSPSCRKFPTRRT